MSQRTILRVEQLEHRQLLSGYQPTIPDQVFLEELNDARANPAAYGASIGLDLSLVAPSQPLALDPLLIQAASLHSQDMSANGYFAHNTPSGTDPGQRMTAAGFAWTSWGESIAGGSVYAQPGDALQGLIVDAGVTDLGHRRQLLAMDPIFQTQEQVGIGIVQAGSGPLTNYYTIDSAQGTDPRAFITGVVFNDSNLNGKYDAGEGLGNVTISVSGVGSVASFGTGGYNIAVNPGTYTITASGAGLAAPISRTVSVGAQNVRLNFAQNTTPHFPGFVANLYQSVLGRTGSSGEIGFWVSTLQAGAAPTDVASAIEHSLEARTRLVNGWYTTYLNRGPGPGETSGWASSLVSGATETQVLSAIIGSNEFFSNVAGGSNSSYIQTLYQRLLNRNVDSGGLSWWLSVLPRVGRGGVANALMNSAEYRAIQINADYINILHRPSAPSANEVNFWVNSGLDFTSIRVAFEGSQEQLLKG